MNLRYMYATAAMACLSLIAAGCAVETVDDPEESSDTEAENIGAAEQAVWTCEGWIPELFQYCLTRCGNGTKWHNVGAETAIPYGSCTTEAQQFCQARWGNNAKNVCWGWNY